jgi:hypothetical protein
MSDERPFPDICRSLGTHIEIEKCRNLAYGVLLGSLTRDRDAVERASSEDRNMAIAVR